jgi:hypothetical protein
MAPFSPIPENGDTAAAWAEVDFLKILNNKMPDDASNFFFPAKNGLTQLLKN